MAGRRKQARNLSGSWADVSSEDDVSDGGESVEIQESEDEARAAAQSIEVVDTPSALNTHHGVTGNPSPRRSMRTSQQSLDPPIDLPRTPISARKSPRLGSRTNSIEPEFIMPSMLASGSVRGTPAKTPPMANSIRARKGKPLAGSRMTPSRVMRSTPKKDSPKSKRAHAREGKPIITSLWSQVIQPILAYILGVLGYAMIHLKPLFGIMVALLAVVYGLKFAFNSTLGSLSILPNISNIVPSPCSVPIINLLPMCGNSFAPGATPEFEDLMKVQESFEEILQSTAEGSILPLEMKRSEASVRDLKYVVTYSNLPSKAELVFEFQGFIDVARQAAGDLTKFNSKVGRAVDHIISTNKHTLQVIDGVVETDASRGAISKWLWGVQLTQDHLLRQYLQHTSQVEEEIERLIIEAQVLLRILEDLDGRLDVIHDVVTRDGVNVRDSREELFEQLWTKLGGNRKSVEKHNQQLQLLKSVNSYRRQAWSHVTQTLLRLQAISAGLEDLRERVALPEVVGVEMVPLQQHIETIQMGVDRLEQVRANSRSVEGDVHRKVLDSGDTKVGKERMVDGKPSFSV